jgi:hypothetical protein
VSLIGFKKEKWPISWQSEFYSSMHIAQRNAFEMLRFTVNPKMMGDSFGLNEGIKEPLHCSFSRLPMYDYTGRSV